MGGVITRWALKDMEQNGVNHQTRLFINWDGPMQGANVPLAYQYLSRHLRSLYLQTNASFLLGTGGLVSNQIALIHYEISNALNLSDFPAAQQMLINHLTTGFALNNFVNTEWEQELNSKGYPTQCRNVAVSNGSECAINQGFTPDATLLNFSGNFSTTFWGDLIGQVAFPLAGVTLGGNFLPFLGGILPGKNTISGNMALKAQPSAGSTDAIYSCNITYTKKLLWLFNITSTITNVSYNSTPSVLAIDGTEGGYYPIPIAVQAISGSSWIAKYGISFTSIPLFNFVPVTSSLDIGSSSNALTISDYSNRYIGAQPPVAPKNSPFANFTTAFDPQSTLIGTTLYNEQHIQIATRNGACLAAELNGSPIVSDCSGTCSNNSISGSSLLCNSGVYSINASNNSTYNWTASPSSMVSLNQSGNNVTVTRVNNGNFSLSAAISNTCITTPIIITKPIQAGDAGISSINLSWLSSCFGGTSQSVKLDATPSSAGSNWRWTVSQGKFAFTSNNNVPSIQGYVTGSALLNLSYNGSICQTPLTTGVTAYTNCSYNLAVVPNPATSNINLSINNSVAGSQQSTKVLLSDTTGNDNNTEQKLITNTEGITNIYLYDFYTNQLVKKWTYQEDNSGTYNLNVADLKRGIYVLKMERDNVSSTTKIILQ